MVFNLVHTLDDDHLVVKYSLALLLKALNMSLSHFEGKNFYQFCTASNFQDWMSALLFNPSVGLRAQCTEILFDFCLALQWDSSPTSPFILFFTPLLALLPKAEHLPFVSEGYFVLLNKLLRSLPLLLL